MAQAPMFKLRHLGLTGQLMITNPVRVSGANSDYSGDGGYAERAKQGERAASRC